MPEQTGAWELDTWVYRHCGHSVQLGSSSDPFRRIDDRGGHPAEASLSKSFGISARRTRSGQAISLTAQAFLNVGGRSGPWCPLSRFGRTVARPWSVGALTEPATT